MHGVQQPHLRLAEADPRAGRSRANFADELARPLPEIRPRIRAGYRLYLHKAYRLAETLARAGGIHLASTLPDDEVRRLHLRPVSDPRALVAAWAADPAAPPIAFLDEAHRLCAEPQGAA